MDLVKVNISPAFVRQRTVLTARELLYGLANGLVDSDAAADLDGAGRPVVRIEEVIRFRVEALADAERAQDEEAIQGKWLYLVLAWIFEHRESSADPLGTVEEVYADFGHPDAIVGFVRYMPSTEPDLGSREANEHRLYEKWKAYLDAAAAVYAPSSGQRGAGNE